MFGPGIWCDPTSYRIVTSDDHDVHGLYAIFVRRPDPLEGVAAQPDRPEFTPFRGIARAKRARPTCAPNQLIAKFGDHLPGHVACLSSGHEGSSSSREGLGAGSPRRGVVTFRRRRPSTPRAHALDLVSPDHGGDRAGACVSRSRSRRARHARRPIRARWPMRGVGGPLPRDAS
jgi:hypothetical protein